MAMAQSRLSRGKIQIRTENNVGVQKTPAAQIPVYINNHNRLTTTKAMTEWLLKAGTKRIVILDNGSTYAPLLEWYEKLSEGVEVVKQSNLGPWAFWESQRHTVQATPYVVTDSDLVPA